MKWTCPEVEDENIIIRRASHLREGWENQFRLMAENGDDKVLDRAQADASRWDGMNGYGRSALLKEKTARLFWIK